MNGPSTERAPEAMLGELATGREACGDGITEGAADVLKELDLGHLLAAHALIKRVVVTAPSGAQAALEPVAGERRLPLAYVIPRTIYSMQLASAQRFSAAPPTLRGTGWTRRIGAMDDGRSNYRASRRPGRGGGSAPIS